jgi:hypothetical protein
VSITQWLQIWYFKERTVMRHLAGKSLFSLSRRAISDYTGAKAHGARQDDTGWT